MKCFSQISTLVLTLLFLVNSAGLAQSSNNGNKDKKTNKGKIEQSADRSPDSLNANKDRAAQVSDSTKPGKGRQERLDDSLESNNGKPEGAGQGQRQGNAYGKNKGELSGREFGQARAEAARKLNQEVERLVANVENAEEISVRAKSDIAQAEERLEEEELSDVAKEAKVEQIERARQQLSELEQIIQNQRAKINNARQKLEALKNGMPSVDKDSTEVDIPESEDATSE